MTTKIKGKQKVLHFAALWNEPHWCCCNYAQKIILSARIAASRLLPRCSSRMVLIGASSDGGLVQFHCGTGRLHVMFTHLSRNKQSASPTCFVCSVRRTSFFQQSFLPSVDFPGLVEMIDFRTQRSAGYLRMWPKYFKRRWLTITERGHVLKNLSESSFVT